MNITIVSSGLNESENIPDFMSLIQELRSFFRNDFRVVFVDNGSTDISPVLLSKYAEFDKELTLIANPLGSQYADGIEAALSNSTTNYCLLIPSDMQFAFQDIVNVLESFLEFTLEGKRLHCMILTRRKLRNDGFYNKWRGMLWRRIVTALFGVNASLDPASQLRIICRDCVKKGTARNFLWDVENMAKFTRKSTNWFLVDVAFNPRLKGHSTLGSKRLRLELSAFFGLIRLIAKISRNNLQDEAQPKL